MEEMRDAFAHSSRRSARQAFTELAESNAQASDASIKQSLETLVRTFQTDLRDQLARLPKSAVAQIESDRTVDQAFDPTRYSLQRFMLRRWGDWLTRDADMPPLVRSFARLDASGLSRLTIDAGLLHVAILASEWNETQRGRLLGWFEQGDATRVLALMRDLPPKHPRREIVKARLHWLLSAIERTRPGELPTHIGRCAVADGLARLDPDSRNHIRTAWPAEAYNTMIDAVTNEDPDWRLDDATWQRLIGAQGATA